MRYSSRFSLALCVSTFIFSPVMGALPSSADTGLNSVVPESNHSTKMTNSSAGIGGVSTKAAGLIGVGAKPLGSSMMTGKTASGEACTCGGPEPTPTPTPAPPPKPDIKSPDSGYPTPPPPVDSGAGSLLTIVWSQTKLSCLVINMIAGVLVLYA